MKKNAVERVFGAIVENPDVFVGATIIILFAWANVLLMLNDRKDPEPEFAFRYERYCMDGKIVYAMILNDGKERETQFYVSDEKCDGRPPSRR